MRPPMVEWSELKDVMVYEDLKIRSVIESQVDHCQQQNDIGSFLIYDLGSIISKYKTWLSVFSNIMPSYVVGCNADSTVLKTLSRMGARFSCANKNEIDRVIEAGIDVSRVMFTNPIKQSSHIKYCGKIGLSLMAFDSELELKKIKAHAPKAELVLQVSASIDENCSCEMEWMRGCNVKHVCHLLTVAQELGLHVTGISAELGRSTTSHGAAAGPVVERAVKILKEAYDAAVKLGLNVKFIDLGNIMRDWSPEDSNIIEIGKSLQTALSCNFPRSLGVQLVGQVDHYFISQAVTLVTSVIAKRCLMPPASSISTEGLDHPGSDSAKLCYYLNDGVYGAFSRLLCDQIRLSPTVLRADEDMPQISSSLMGPTCDDLDCIVPVCLLPELAVGDWLIFNNMGGVSTVPNNQSDVSYYVVDKSHWSKMYSTPADDDEVIYSECCSASLDCPVNVSVQDENLDYNINNSSYEWLDI